MAVVGETGSVGFGPGAAQVHNNLIDAVHRAISFHPSPHAKADYGNILARLLARQAKAHDAAGQTHGGAGFAQTPAGSGQRSFLPVMPDGTQTTGGVADPSEYPNINGIPLGYAGGFGGPALAETPVPGQKPGQVVATLTGGPGGTPTMVGQGPMYDPPGINTSAVLSAILKGRPSSGPGGGLFDPPGGFGTAPAGLSPLLQAILNAGRGNTGAIFGGGPVAT